MKIDFMEELKAMNPSPPVLDCYNKIFNSKCNYDSESYGKKIAVAR